MSLSVALQSVVFYIVSCAPCHQARHKHRVGQQAKKEREARARDSTNKQGYQQPEPFSTNPYWSEEIKMGPHFQRKKSKTAGQKPEEESASFNAPPGPMVPKSNISTAPPTTNTLNNADGTTVHSLTITDSNSHDSFLNQPKPPSPAVTKGGKPPRFKDPKNDSLPSNWKYNPHMSHDEDWGHELSRTGHILYDGLRNAASSAGRFIESSLSKDARSKSADDASDENPYFIPINHPLNDYNPPVARPPPFKKAVSWMVLPPPPARFMTGKAPAQTSARGSTNRSKENLLPVSRASTVSYMSHHTATSAGEEILPAGPLVPSETATAANTGMDAKTSI
ncbi:hypothetical protein F4808DRAFT_111093 [Astrocystis sublimbata]|nr:hypothetical protein F4808DRAFT_111093 [Astrocystis sublimbata]